MVERWPCRLYFLSKGLHWVIHKLGYCLERNKENLFLRTRSPSPSDNPASFKEVYKRQADSIDISGLQQSRWASSRKRAFPLVKLYSERNSAHLAYRRTRQSGVSQPNLNPYSWTNLTNMVWVDQPIGVGLSQGVPNLKNEIGVVS